MQRRFRFRLSPSASGHRVMSTRARPWNAITEYSMKPLMTGRITSVSPSRRTAISLSCRYSSVLARVSISCREGSWLGSSPPAVVRAMWFFQALASRVMKSQRP